MQSATKLFENDDFLVTGDALLRTFDRLEVSEFSARSLVMGHSLGDLVAIGDNWWKYGATGSSCSRLGDDILS